MLRRLGINLKMSFPVQNLREEISANRKRHKEIYEEALEGFREKAQAQLEEFREDLDRYVDRVEKGENVNIRLSLNLKRPVHYLHAYDIVLSMLEGRSDEKITLSADEYRALVKDEWEWTQDFSTSNSVYSTTAQNMARNKGYL